MERLENDGAHFALPSGVDVADWRSHSIHLGRARISGRTGSPRCLPAAARCLYAFGGGVELLYSGKRDPDGSGAGFVVQAQDFRGELAGRLLEHRRRDGVLIDGGVLVDGGSVQQYIG